MLIAAMLPLLICSVLGKPPPIRTYDAEKTFSHCLQLGPYAQDPNSVFRVEWNFVPMSRTVDVRFTARNDRGFVGIGFMRNSEKQIVIGHPSTDLRCIQAMYNSYLPLDADANPYNYDIEVPLQHVEPRDYDVLVQLRRNLTVGGKQILSTPNMPFNFTILWAYRIQSVVKGMCNEFSMVPSYTEAATFSVQLGAAQYLVPANQPKLCTTFTGKLKAHQRALDPKAGFFSAENHQNQRIAVLYIGGGMPIESGVNIPSFNAVTGYVLVGEGGNDVCHASLTTAYCKFSGFRDSVGGIAYYEVAFGTTANVAAYVPWTDIGSVTSVAKTVTLPKNGTIVCSVRAYNYARRFRQVSSRTARILAGTAPLKGGFVKDGTPSSPTITAQRSSTTISATWIGWKTEDYSTQSLTTRKWAHNSFEYAVGVVGGNATAVRNWQSVTKTTVTVANLKLRNNVIYFVSVRARNCAGMSTTAVSPGVIVDMYPPIAGRVYDGNKTFRDSMHTRVNTGVSASWGGFVDTGSGLSYFEWAVGTKDPKQFGPTTELLGWRNVGLAVSASNSTLKKSTRRLVPGSKIWVHVRAVDKVGWATTVSSNGTQVVGY